MKFATNFVYQDAPHRGKDAIRYGQNSGSTEIARRPYRTLKSQEVVRQNGLETGFWGGGRWAQSGALSAKPRVVRGLDQLGIALSEFEVKLLAEQNTS